MFVDFNILNQLGSPSINSNTFANRPAAGQTGRLFVSTDTFEIFRDNGTGWDLIGGPGAGTITGTGTATQVAYFTGAQTIGSSANLFWDNTNTRLGIGTSSPGVRLDVHGTGNMLQLNATAATANTLMSFQRLGSNVWRLGDQYSGGLNYFELHNAVINNNAAEFQAATNKATFGALETYSSGGATGSLFSYTLTVPDGTNFTGPNVIGNVNSALTLNLGGNTTVPNSTRQGLEGNSRINFTGPGTLTVTQGASTVRAFSALSSVYSFAGTSNGTITHLAGLRVCFPDNVGLGAINITNNYGILINNQTTGTGTVTYTNRWGIYQEASADVNHFAGAILQGTTTNTGFGIYTNSSFRSDTTTYLAALSGGAVIGSTNALSSSALLQLDSTTGGLLIPRLTTTQRNAIVSAAAGLVIYNTTTTALEFYNGTAWTSGGGGISGSGTTNYLPKFTAATTLGDSRFFDNGTVTFLGNGDVNAAPSTGIFSGTGGSGTNIAGAELRIRGGASTGNAAGGIISFYTSAAGSAGTGVNAATEVMRITGGGVGSQLRIFTTSTDARNFLLGVYGATWNSSLFEIANAESVFNKVDANNGTVIDIRSVGIQRGQFKVSTTTFTVNAVNTLVFGSNNTDQMYLNTSGNLGLNTSTIGSKLQVNGNAAIGYSASTAAPTNGLAVSGNVGIGTTTATSKIQISNTSAAAATVAAFLLNESTNTNTEVRLAFAANANNDIATDRYSYISAINTSGSNGQALRFATNETGNSAIERMRITSGGQVTLSTGSNLSAIAQTGYSLTGSNASSLIDLAGTWNTTGNPTAIKLNITNTASGATAYLMDLQVGAATQFRVTKAGAIRTAAPTTGTANDWKLGTRVAAAVVLDTTQYIELEVGGTLYKLAIVT